MTHALVLTLARALLALPLLLSPGLVAAQGDPLASPLTAALLKPVTLVVSGRPLRQVFETLAASTGMNFVLEREVLAETRVSLSLREVTLDEALRVLQTTQQLERKILNDHTWLIYPSTVAKQREHQDLLVGRFYLTHADVRQAQTLLRNVLKVRDLHVDERLNLLVLRETPEVLAIAGQLLASLDQPEPEVVLELELLEMGGDQLASLGLSWPTEIRWGAAGGGAEGAVTPLSRSDGRRLRATVLNPAMSARLSGMAGTLNLLARPSLRARNREKARLQIGERLPVFSNAVAAASGVTAVVSYQDVGLKLDLLPDVQADDEVVVKLGVELDQLLEQVSPGPGISAYRVGTRSISTTLRLREGQTQLLAGLIGDEDRQAFSGVPRLAEMPLLGRLFGLRSGSRRASELLLLITPHVLRRPSRPVGAGVASGNEMSPGAASMRLRPQARVAGPMAGAELVAPALDPGSAQPAGEARVLDKNTVLIELSTPAEVIAGEAASVVLHNHSQTTLRGVLEFDASLFEFSESAAASGRIAFELSPEGQRSLQLRSRPTAGGSTTTLRLTELKAAAPEGAPLTILVQGEGIVDISSP
ncbi:MAG: hypothetical protein IV097_16400 [Burkholderiaceae bacterium]|nr:hypothetical protein [Burkholderiaceae bacterium]